MKKWTFEDLVSYYKNNKAFHKYVNGYIRGKNITQEDALKHHIVKRVAIYMYEHEDEFKDAERSI